MLPVKSNHSICLALIVACFWLCPSWSSAQSYFAKDFLLGLGTEPSLGSADAPVTITEFSDFQCGYCRKFWAETLPKLKESYIQPGKARFVYRHFAIFGKPSEQAAQAASCAADQGKFWPYHDKLWGYFTKGFVTNSNLKKLASEVQLDAKEFGNCLDNGKHKEKVERETLTAAHLGGRGTPMFFVNDKLLIGAQPFEVFQQAIEGELKAVSVKKKSAGTK